MKTSEILIAATKHLRGHANCCEYDTSDFICNAVDMLEGVPAKRADAVAITVQHEIELFAATHRIKVHGYRLPLVNYMRQYHAAYYISASDPSYWPHRDEWLAALIEKLQKAGD